QTELVEPFGIVIGNSARQYLPLPRVSRDFKSLQLLQHFERSTLANDLRTRLQMLPAHEPAHKLRRSHWLDLLAQCADRQAMNARQQPSLAPLSLAIGSACEVSTKNRASSFHSQQRLLNIGSGQCKRFT